MLIQAEQEISLSSRPKIRRRSSSIPFGYKLDPDDSRYIVEVPTEIEALAKAKQYLDGSSKQEVLDWLLKVTGRRLSRPGFYKVLKRGY